LGDDVIVRKSVFSRFLRRLSPSERHQDAQKGEAPSADRDQKPEDRQVKAQELDRIPFLQQNLK
jgi:hypothetical protein